MPLNTSSLSAFIFLLTLAQIKPAAAEPISCPGKIDHALLEGGHYKPYPYLIPPNTGTENDPPEWDLSERGPNDMPITIHCFPTKDEKVSADVDVPTSVTKCVALDNHFACQ